MTDIFLSYASEDHISARTLAQVFEARNSTNKTWVRREAALGVERGVLVPVLLQIMPEK